MAFRYFLCSLILATPLSELTFLSCRCTFSSALDLFRFLAISWPCLVLCLLLSAVPASIRYRLRDHLFKHFLVGNSVSGPSEIG